MNGGAEYTLSRILHAVDFIESNLDRKFTVADVARRACWSPFHFHRTFSAVVGETLMEYVRRRRLTQAANALRAPEAAIIRVALDAGFDSQEAFTRAFRKQFGTTPGRLRKSGAEVRRHYRAPLTRETLRQHLARNMGEIEMDPKYVEMPAFEVAGKCGRFTTEHTEGIPGLWDEFMRSWTGAGLDYAATSYGVCWDEGESGTEANAPFTYMAAFGMPAGAGLPADLETRTVPANHYAVFTHVGEIHRIKETYAHIFGTWLPASEWTRADGPDFELYDERFNPETMGGEVDIYVPVSPKG